MNGFRILKIAIAAPFLMIPACGDDEPSGLATSFSASLSGANEVPTPVVTPATGTATLTLSGDQISYTITVTNLQNALLAHIHVAPVGVNGPVRMNLCGTGDPQPPCSTSGTGVLVTGTNGTTVGSPAITFEELVSALRSGGAYVNVHTDDGQGAPNTGAGDMIAGEIRGQVVSN
jgi:hypothetical protein